MTNDHVGTRPTASKHAVTRGSFEALHVKCLTEHGSNHVVRHRRDEEPVATTLYDRRRGGVTMVRDYERRDGPPKSATANCRQDNKAAASCDPGMSGWKWKQVAKTPTTTNHRVARAIFCRAALGSTADFLGPEVTRAKTF